MYEVVLEGVPARQLAVVRERLTMDRLAHSIRPMFARVCAALDAAEVRERGRNVILYWGGTAGNPGHPAGREMIECGVELARGIKLPVPLERSYTPAGTVASTVHYGEYERLRAAHDAVQRWCAEHARALRGPNWEVYDHWQDDPAHRRTDVFYLLAPDWHSR
jgi:effector-binding domain-containing protein